MPRCFNISTSRLELAAALETATATANKSIHHDLFAEDGPPDEPLDEAWISEITNEMVLGEIEPADALSHEPISNFVPLRRLLSVDDKAMAAIVPGAIDMRRKLILLYVDELKQDLRMLWEAKNLTSHAAAMWDIDATWDWNIRTRWALARIQIAGRLYGYSFDSAVADMAVRALSELEDLFVALTPSGDLRTI